MAAPRVDFQGQEMDLRWNQLLLAKDLVNHNYVMKPPLKPGKGTSFGPFPESFHVLLCQATRAEAPLFGTLLSRAFPDGSASEESACTVGDLGLIPGLGRSPGERNTHSSILAWRIPWSCKESDTTEQLSLSLCSLYLFI